MELLVEVKKFVSKDGHDIEFVPTEGKGWEVWVDGLFIENLPIGSRPSKVRAQYYYETRCTALGDDVEIDSDEEASGDTHEVIAVVHAATQ
jgi:hypothetical protein